MAGFVHVSVGMQSAGAGMMISFYAEPFERLPRSMNTWDAKIFFKGGLFYGDGNREMV